MDILLNIAGVALFGSTTLLFLFFSAFESSKNIEEKGRMNLWLDGAAFCKNKKYVEEYIEPGRRHQVMMLIRAQQLSFLAFLLLFIISVGINKW